MYTIKHGDILRQYGQHVQQTSALINSSDAGRLPAPAWNGSRRLFGSWKLEFQQSFTSITKLIAKLWIAFGMPFPLTNFDNKKQLHAVIMTLSGACLIQNSGIEYRLMDYITSDIDKHPVIGTNSTALLHFTTEMTSIVNDMRNSTCPVDDASESSFIARLRSKLHLQDCSHFGKDMNLKGEKEAAKNLVSWLRKLPFELEVKMSSRELN